MSDIDRAIDEIKKDAEARIAALEGEKRRRAALTVDQRLAEALHDSLCRWNHTDGCGWLYEIDNRRGVVDWDGLAHAEWLKHAEQVREILPGMSDEAIVNVTTALKGIG